MNPGHQLGKLSLVLKKTKAVVFSKKVLCNSPALTFCGSFIERVVTHKHLGMILTSTLDWTPHINYVCLKASRKLNVEVVPKKISDYQVSEKIHSKAGAKENIIMEIPLWPSAAENV